MKYLANVSTLSYDSSLCKGCGRCTEVCPHGVFTMQGKIASVTDSDLCMECGACERNCAFSAIKVKSGVGCAAALIHSLIKGGEPVCGCSGESSSSCC